MDSTKALDRVLDELSEAKAAARRLRLAMAGYRRQHPQSGNADLDLQALGLEVLAVEERILRCMVTLSQSPAVAPSFGAARADSAFRRFIAAVIRSTRS